MMIPYYVRVRAEAPAGEQVPDGWDDAPIWPGGTAADALMASIEACSGAVTAGGRCWTAAVTVMAGDATAAMHATEVIRSFAMSARMPSWPFTAVEVMPQDELEAMTVQDCGKRLR